MKNLSKIRSYLSSSNKFIEFLRYHSFEKLSIDNHRLANGKGASLVKNNTVYLESETVHHNFINKIWIVKRKRV